MADNTTLATNTGGDVIRDKDRSGVKTQVFGLDVNIGGTEQLMTSAAIADATANPTVPAWQMFAMVWNGTTWDRVRGTTALGMAVDSARLNTIGPGFLKVSDEPSQVFYDPFDAALDTTNMWTSTQGSSGVAAAVSNGTMTLGTGTVANGYSKLTSIPTFKPFVPAWLKFSCAVSLPDGAAPIVNSYRYWGSGTTPGTPTAAAPVTDGYGFELNTDQKLRAVVYAGGVRTVIADLSSSGTNKQPLDASNHRYIIDVRTDRTYFFIDTLDTAGLVATTSFQAPNVQTLPVLMLAIGGSTPPASNTQLMCTGSAVSDTGRNNVQISDATYPWRKAAVGKNGGQAVKGASVVGYTMAIAAATPITSPGLDVSEAGNVTFIVKNTIAGTAYTGAPVVVFEQSDDNVSWGPLQVTRSDSGATASTIGFAAGSANTSIMLDAALEGVNYVRARCTTAPTANGMTIMFNPGGLAFTPAVGVIGPLPAGAALLGSTKLMDTAGSIVAQVRAASTLPTQADTALVVTVRELIGAATGGLTIYRLLSAATTNAASVKASAGTLYTIVVTNTNAAARFLKFYNKASAPTVGTDTPVLTFVIPGNTTGAGMVIPLTLGWAFATGIALAVTAAIADADTTAVAANEVVVNLGYK